METHFEKQELSIPLRDPAIREAIRMLDLPEGSDGLDAGCGIGLQCLQLLEVLGTDGHVTGIDTTPEFLERGREIVKVVPRSGSG